jgi:hypothetical protein
VFPELQNYNQANQSCIKKFDDKKEICDKKKIILHEEDIVKKSFFW